MSISNENKLFAKYVSQNILGMIGISVYILADTFFISLAEGANGITALNLVLPVYSLIFAIGSMIGVGSAIRFKIMRARNDDSAEKYFSNAIICAFIIGAFFMICGAFIPDRIIALLGGDTEIVSVGTPYTRIFMMFAPVFMWNHICNAFVRNDNAPAVAMTATLCSSIFNIVMDYILMFPLKMGMAGAALATALSPVVGVIICCTHLLSKKSTVNFNVIKPSIKKLFEACQLGVSAFVGEISSGVTTVVFNMLILKLAGNIGVAAYGVIANTSMVAVAIFNGVSQGSQPLLSEYYGKGETKKAGNIVRLSICTAFVLAVVIIILMYFGADIVTVVFNSENNPVFENYAVRGLHLYFIGFIFAGFNIVGTGILSATESAKWAFVSSITRGFIAIIICAFVLSALLGLDGVWLAFPAAESITSIVVIIALFALLR
jgi:putative MATE family efflux protein